MLEYPFPKEAIPVPGVPKEVAPGIFWLRMPLPYRLDHINIWLLEDGEGWTLVDTGLDYQDTHDAYQDIIQNHLGGRPLNRVIVTHMHPDHIGMAGWLTREFDCDFLMTTGEYLHCHRLVSDTGRKAPESAIRFYHAAGYNREQLENYKKRFGSFGKHISPLPETYRRLKDTDYLKINDHYWQVVVGSGHSPEHACLFSPELNILISGDQILPRITPNVSIHPIEVEANPLDEWLTSCVRLRKQLPSGLLVLPAHQEPFYGLHERLTALLVSHEQALSKLEAFLTEPARAIDCIPVMFNRRIDDGLMFLAIGEALAHLRYLEQLGKINRETDASGVDYYKSNHL